MVSGTTALLATIGERDPHGLNRAREGARTRDGEVRPTGPLLAARRFRPCFALLLGTPEVRPSLEATAEALREEAVPQVETVELEGDASNFDRMSVEIDRVLQRFERELSAAERVDTVISSGTPQMGQALLIVALARLPQARFWQALDPRYVPDDEHRLRELDARAMHLRLDLSRAAEAAKGGQWPLAAALFERATETEGEFADKVRRNANAGARLVRSLDHAENFAFAEAADAAKPTRKDACRSHLERVSQWYRRIANGQRGSTQLPAELAALADRQLKAGLPARACITAAIAWETTVTVGLRKLGLDPDRIAEDEVSRIPDSMGERLVPLEDGRHYRLEGQRARRDLLEALLGEGRVTECLRKASSAIDRLARARNDLVHRGQTEGSLEDLAGVVEASLAELDEVQRAFGWGSWKAAPTTADRVQDLIDRIASAWASPSGARLAEDSSRSRNDGRGMPTPTRGVHSKG